MFLGRLSPWILFGCGNLKSSISTYLRITAHNGTQSYCRLSSETRESFILHPHAWILAFPIPWTPCIITTIPFNDDPLPKFRSRRIFNVTVDGTLPSSPRFSFLFVDQAKNSPTDHPQAIPKSGHIGALTACDDLFGCRLMMIGRLVIFHGLVRLVGIVRGWLQEYGAATV